MNSTAIAIRPSIKTVLQVLAPALSGPAPAQAAGFNAVLEGQCNPPAGSPGATCSSPDAPWQTTKLTGWGELASVPVRVKLTGGPVTNQPITINFDHSKTVNSVTYTGVENLWNFTPS